ncbi:hypothetical protein LCGC14_0597140 [marine sediment metagenome]|uniref:Uncharacterized protein n=1 Tax=marine sediment metagenome TaxID=412755 RepID=A0A0F9TXW7_9ZZZZ
MMEATQIKLYQYYNFLFWYYVVLEMTPKEIAKTCKVNEQTICRWLRKFNIPQRPRIENIKIALNRPGKKEKRSIGGLTKPEKKAKVRELEKEINFLSLAFMGSDNPKKSHPKAYADLQRAKTKQKQLKLELKMTPAQLKKLKTHYGMGVEGAELTSVYKGLPKTRSVDDVYKIDDNNKIITITVFFEYNPKKNPVVITSIKKYFIEILPKETRSKMNYKRPILFAHNYSFIKNPVSVKYGEKKRLLTNRASGIIIKYEFLGLLKDWKKTVIVMRKLIKQMRLKKFKYVKVIKSVKITVGFELKNR